MADNRGQQRKCRILYISNTAQVRKGHLKFVKNNYVDAYEAAHEHGNARPNAVMVTQLG